MRAALYIRVSTERQVRVEENSLKTQQERLTSYARSQGWQVAEVYSDEGRSAKNLDRPHLQRLLDDVRAGKIDVVLTYKYDRISRSTRDLLELIQIFADHKVDFVSTTQQLDTSTPIGKLILTVLVGIGQFEREQTSERTIDKMFWRAENGLWNGGSVPYGYRSTESKRLLPHPTASREVQRAFELYLELRSGPQVIERLRAEFPGGRAWAKSNLATVLSNPIYTGRLRYDGGIYPGQHDALIDESTFQKAQEIAKANLTNKGSANRKTMHGLAIHKVAQCICGQPLRINVSYGGTPPNRKRYFWAECKHAKSNTTGERCTVRRIQGKEIEGALIDLLGQAAQDPTIIHEAMRLHFDLVQQKMRKEKDELEALEREPGELDRKIQQLTASLAGTSSDAVRQELVSLGDEKRQVEARVAELRLMRSAPLPSKRNLADLQKSLELFKTLYQRLEISERVELFEAFFDKVVWTGDNLVVHFKGNGVAKRIPEIAGKVDAGHAMDHVPPGLVVRSGQLTRTTATTCAEKGCKGQIHAKDLCQDHYKKSMRGPGKPGHTTNGKGKLTPEQCAQILESIRTGSVPKAELARRFGVSRMAIYKLLKRSGS